MEVAATYSTNARRWLWASSSSARHSCSKDTSGYVLPSHLSTLVLTDDAHVSPSGLTRVLCTLWHLQGFDCTRDQSNQKLYLDIDPSIECYTDAHANIRQKATIGMGVWSLMLMKITCTFFTRGGKYRYSFLTTKLEDDWYFWELILLGRKVAIMACGLFNTSTIARGWFCGSLVIIVALVRKAKRFRLAACQVPVPAPIDARQSDTVLMG